MITNIGKSIQRVADSIKKSRRDKGKTQAQVARRLQISQNAYSKLETGKTKLTLLNLRVIAEYLEIGLFELFIGS